MIGLFKKLLGRIKKMEELRVGKQIKEKLGANTFEEALDLYSQGMKRALLIAARGNGKWMTIPYSFEVFNILQRCVDMEMKGYV